MIMCSQVISAVFAMILKAHLGFGFSQACQEMSDFDTGERVAVPVGA